MRLGAGNRGDALHEIEHAFRRAAFLVQNGRNDFRRLGLGEAALAQEALPLLVLAGDDPFPRRPDAGDEGRGRGVGEARQRGRRLMGEALRGELAVPDGDLLEIFDAPEIAVHADGAEIERGDAERLRADLAVPAVEPPEIQVRVAVRQTPGLDRMRVVDQKQEHVAVAGVERGRVLGHVHERVVGHGRPVQHAGNLPARVACAVARDLHHGGDQLMVPDAAIVRAGDGAKLDPAVLGLQRLHQLGAVRQQAVLQIDAGQRRRQIAQIARRRADQAAKLAETPMGGRDGASRPGRSARAARRHRGWLRPGSRGSPPSGPCSIRPRADRGIELRQRQITLVIGPGKPLRRNAADPIAAGRSTLKPGTAVVGWAARNEPRRWKHRCSWPELRDGRREPLSISHPVTENRAELSLSGSRDLDQCKYKRPHRRTRKLRHLPERSIASTLLYPVLRPLALTRRLHCRLKMSL